MHSVRMSENFIIELAQQPLFRRLGAIVVLLLTDMKPLYGIIAGLVWFLWVFVGTHAVGRRIFF